MGLDHVGTSGDLMSARLSAGTRLLPNSSLSRLAEEGPRVSASDVQLSPSFSLDPEAVESETLDLLAAPLLSRGRRDELVDVVFAEPEEQDEQL